MSPTLPTLSFFLAAILAVFIVSRRIRVDLPNLSVLCWLIIYNIVHGVNSTVWAGNTHVKIPGWCDIVTKLLLGANVALPAAFICISRRLELISSTRKISVSPRSKRIQTTTDVILCLVLPIVYISLSTIGQDHRFDLVRDYGCSASIHPSTPALVVTWLPPLMTCSVSLLFSGFAIHNLCRHSMARFSVHVSSRSDLSTSSFIRSLATSMIMTSVLALSAVFFLFSPPILKPWISFSEVHKHIHEISIIGTKQEVLQVQLMWWGLTAVSIVYTALLLTMGEGIRDAVRWVTQRVQGHHIRRARAPVLMNNETRQSKLSALLPSITSPKADRQPLDLKSGWDDMLDIKIPKHSRSRAKTSVLLPLDTTSSVGSCPRKTPSPSPSSAGSHSPCTITREDSVFAVSKLKYRDSPIAHTLALASPPPVYSSPKKTSYNITPWKPTSSYCSAHATSPAVSSAQEKPNTLTTDSKPEDTVSLISSIFDTWPAPPLSIPTSPTPPRRTSPPPSRSPPSCTSLSAPPASSFVKQPSHLLCEARELIDEAMDIVFELPERRPSSPADTSERRSSVKVLKRSLSQDSGVLGTERMNGTTEAMYMTALKETV